MGGVWGTTPVASLPLCGANHKSPSPKCAAVIAVVVLTRIFTDFVWWFLTRIFTELSPDYHCIVIVRAIFVIIGVFLPNHRVGIQPERLNAEEIARLFVAGVWSVSVTPGMPVIKRKAFEWSESIRRGK